jgi:hypothetical protein
VHDAQSPPSSAHWNSRSAASVTSSVPLKVKVPSLLSVDAGGPEMISVSGAVVSPGAGTAIVHS